MDRGVGDKRARARLARAILFVAGLSLVIGIAVDHYQSRAADPWRARLVNGDPVEVRFLCEVNPAVDCKTNIKITYQKRDSKWCAIRQPAAQREVPEQDWCNGDPEHGTISIFGVVYSFDRFGIMKAGDHLVGRLYAA